MPIAGAPSLATLGRAALYLMLAVLFNWEAEAADKLRLALQKTGTFAWELAIIRERGLDQESRSRHRGNQLASPEAAKIALMGGAADMILGDWLWVARQRNLGRRLVFAPYSTALGAVMVPAASPIEDLCRLERQKNRGRGRSPGQELAIAPGARARSRIWTSRRRRTLFMARRLCSIRRPRMARPMPP